MKNLITRSLTGIIYIALIISALIFDNQYLFCGIFATIAIIANYEFSTLMKSEIKVVRILDAVGTAALFLGIAYYTAIAAAPLALTPYLIYIVIRFTTQLYITSENPVNSLSKSMFGQIYIALPMALMNVIANTYGANILLALFIFIWINDTGAFCVGSLIGKNRLFERISPKKSWEGFFGGFVVVLATAAIISIYFNDYFTGLTLTEWLILGGTSSIFATWGDLNESLIKRTVKVKDSGKILPGHGGMLDRIDSLLLVVPAALIVMIIIKSAI